MRVRVMLLKTIVLTTYPMVKVSGVRLVGGNFGCVRVVCSQYIPYNTVVVSISFPLSQYDPTISPM